MNTAHLHLLLNHVPVIGTAVAVALLGYAVARKSEELTRVSLGMLAILAVVGIGVFQTGEPAEEQVEGLAGVEEARIERHEEAALAATLLLAATGVVALGGLIALRREGPRLVGRVGRWTLVLALAPTAAMAYAAYLGGQIRHTEIRGSPDAPVGEVITERSGAR